MKLAKKMNTVSLRLGLNTNILAAAAFAAAPLSTHAATIALTATDTAGQSSFVSGLHFDGNPVSAANDYTVGTGLALRTPFDSATDITFAGNSLTFSGTASTNTFALVIKNLTNTTTTVNNLTLDNGQVQNGGNGAGAATSVTLASNNITLGVNGGTINAGTTGRTLTVTGPISGTLGGALTLAPAGGLVVLTGTNTYNGNTIVNGGAIVNGNLAGAVRANDGVNISSTGNLTLNSGVIEGSANITHAGGTGAGQINLLGAASGFSAVGGDVTVAIGGTAAPTPLVWGTAPFAMGSLVLNDANATNALTFANAIEIGTAGRSIFVAANTATLSGAITGTTGALNAFGNGILVLSNAANNFTGVSVIGSSANSATASTGGAVRATASNALGTGGILLGNGGNATTGRLELANNVVLPNAITQFSRATVTSVSIENISGSNELSNTITITSGGGTNLIQSDAGVLTLSGANAAAGGVALQSSAGARTVTLQGVGNGVVSGIVRDSNAVAGATIAITKAGTGTWALTNANTYTGVTTVTAGTLSLGDGATGHDGTIATTASIVNNGTLLYNRFGSVASDRVISGSGVVAKSGVGTQVLTGANTYTGNTVVAAGTLQTTIPAYTNGAVFSGAAGTDIQGGKLVLDFTGGTSPVAGVKSTLDGGFAGNFASGLLRSTNATTTRGLGYGTTGTVVTIMATVYGDATLDGTVDFNDFLALQANFGAAGTRFDQGNFNYDGFTDFNDFLVLQSNFGSSINGTSVSVTAEQVGVMNAFFAAETTAVPEPASLAVVGLGATALLRRRRA